MSILKVKNNETVKLFIDATKVAKEEIDMIACHKKEVIGNVIILTTYRIWSQPCSSTAQ